MAKNMTRKGLAIASAASLFVAGFVGATPAFAAPTALVTTALAGTATGPQNTLLGAEFVLKTLAVGASSGDVVRYEIKGAVAGDFVASTGIQTDSAADLTTSRSWANATPVNVSVANKVAYVDSEGWTVGQYNLLKLDLDTTAVTATRTITITPFIDNVVADGEITSGEVRGETVSITFNKASEVTPTTTLKEFALGASRNTLAALVTLDKGINMASTFGAATVGFTVNGADVASSTAVAATWSATDGAYLATASSATGTIATGEVYSARATLTGNTAASGSASISTPATVAITAFKVGAAGNYVDSGTSYLDVTSALTDDKVRAGSGSITVNAEVLTLTAGAVNSGHSVTFTIREVSSANSVDAAGSISAGGKTLTNTSTTTVQSITATGTTDADGIASVTVSYAGLKNGNKFEVTANATGSTVATAVREFTAEDSVATAIVDTNKLGGANGDNPVHAATVGGAISVAYRVVDQFGQTPVGTLRLKVAARTGAQAMNATVNLSNGAGTLSLTDNSDAAASYVATATVERQQTDLSWLQVGSVTETSTINVASALPAPTRVTVAQDPVSTATSASNVLSSSALATVDARLSRSSVDLPSIPAANSTLSGLVYGANGAPQAGATVTLSAPGVMFVTNALSADSAHYSLGSTTIKTDASGAWGEVDVLSTVAGKHTVTVTSGTGSTTIDIYFGAAAGDKGDKVTITAPTSVKPGSTLQVSAVVTDKFGNPVNTNPTAGSTADVAVTYTGPGLIVGTLPTETDSSGKITFNVLLGVNDSGTISMTVTYRPTGAAGAAATNKSATATVVVGTVVGAQGTSVKRTGNTVAVRVTGYAKSRIVLNGVRVASRSTLGTLSRNLTLRAGSNVIQIVVDGQVIRTVRYTR